MRKLLTLCILLCGVALGQVPQTPNLHLNLPATGSQIGVWGPLINGNSQSLDTLLACYGTASTPGTIVYYTGSHWVCLTGNTSGTQVLQETSTGLPSWTTVTGLGTITGVAGFSGGGLIGGGTSGAVTLGLTNTCAANQVLIWNGTLWACGSNGTGSVTSVGNGTGLTGGPITTTGTLSLLSSYQIAQGCSTNQLTTWNGSAWVCNGAPIISAANMTSFPIFNQNTTGTAATITGALSIGNTPLTTTGDVMTIAAGVLARLAQGANGTFLGVTGGVLGYYTPAGTGTVTNTVGNLRANTMTVGNGVADVETLDQTTNKYADIPTSGAPANPASGYQRFYANSSGVLACLTSAGANCLLTGPPLGTAAQIPVMNAGATAYAAVTMSQDCTISATGVMTCLKTNNTAFVASATTDTTNASNISSGTLNTSRLPAVANVATGFQIGAAAATGHYLRGNNTNYVDSTIQAADVPTLNQNSTGTAGNLSGTPALPNGTTATTQALGDSTTDLATDAFVLNNAITNPMTTTGDTISSTGAAATRVAGPTTPATPFVYTSIPSGGLATLPVWSKVGLSGRVVIGTTDNILGSDNAHYVSYCNNAGSAGPPCTTATAVAVALPQAGTGCGTSADFCSNFVTILIAGPGLVTVTTTTSTINGNSTATQPLLIQNQACRITSDNTNYQAHCWGDNSSQPVQTDTGTANAYAVNCPGVALPLQIGAMCLFQAGNANTGASTINVSATGINSLVRPTGSALIANDIVGTPSITPITWNGSQWQIMNSATIGGGTVTHTGNLTQGYSVSGNGPADTRASSRAIDATAFCPTSFAAGKCGGADNMGQALTAAANAAGTTSGIVDARGFYGVQVIPAASLTQSLLGLTNGGRVLLGDVRIYIDGPAATANSLTTYSFDDGVGGAGANGQRPGTPALLLPNQVNLIGPITRPGAAKGANFSVCTGPGTPVAGCNNPYPIRSWPVTSVTCSGTNNHTCVVNVTVSNAADTGCGSTTTCAPNGTGGVTPSDLIDAIGGYISGAAAINNNFSFGVNSVGSGCASNPNCFNVQAAVPDAQAVACASSCGTLFLMTPIIGVNTSNGGAYTTSASGAATVSYGTAVQNIGFTTFSPTIFEDGVAGYENKFGQERNRVDELSFFEIPWGLIIRGITQNSGPYNDIEHLYGAWTGFQCGGHLTGYIESRGSAVRISEGATSNASPCANPPWAAWVIDSNNSDARNLFQQGVIDGVLVGSQMLSQGVKLGSISCGFGGNPGISSCTRSMEVSGTFATTDVVGSGMWNEEENIGALTLTSVANASGATTVYTGTISGGCGASNCSGASNAFANTYFTVAGFTTAANNGTFLATASSATTITLLNASGVAETHAATVTQAYSNVFNNVTGHDTGSAGDSLLADYTFDKNGTLTSERGSFTNFRSMFGGGIDLGNSGNLVNEATTAGGTYVVGDLACPTATNTIGSCPLAANTFFIGILAAKNGTLPVVARTGIATVTSFASATWSFGETICVDTAHAGKSIDVGLDVACATAQPQVGIVVTTTAAGTSHAGVALQIGGTAAAGSGSGTVSNCGTGGSIGYYAATGTTITCVGADWEYASHVLTAGSAGLFDASAATTANALKVPSQAGLTSNGTSSIAYDSTAKNFHIPVNGADALAAGEASAIASGTIPKSSSSAISLLTGSSISDNATAVTIIEALNHTPAARTSGVAPYFQLTQPADTGLTAATEAPGFQTLTATRTWATTGTVATQREHLFAAPTYASASASQTFTKAATMAITGAPIAGSNAIITNAYAFWVQAGLAQFDGTLAVAGHLTLEGVTSTGATGTAKLVFSTSPSLITPALGVATATSLIASGIVDGTAPVTITTGTSATLGAATYSSGYTYNQEATAGTSVTYTLPATAVGLQYCVKNSIVSGTGAADTGVLKVYPPASSFVILNGVRNTVGGGGTHGVSSGGAAGDAACFVAIDATDWEVYVQVGSWTEN